MRRRPLGWRILPTRIRGNHGRLLLWRSLLHSHYPIVNVRWGRLPAYGHGRCRRCATPWWACRSHVTHYSDWAGVFVLCERCWGELDPSDRMPYYRQHLRRWEAAAPRDPREAAAIRRAVRLGK